MSRSLFRGALILVLACLFAAGRAKGQTATIDTSVPPLPGSATSMMGQAPGAGGGTLSNPPGAGGILGSRAGGATPHGIPTAVSNPGAAAGPTEGQVGIAAPSPEPISASPIPLYGTLDIPLGADDDGPPGGLTLDQAIGLSLDRNRDLRAKFMEIPQAQADILQANLRANPILYFDGQLLQFNGSKFSRAVPGGPSQYDLNISYPIDISRKRQARTQVAIRAKKVLEAQYQDAVRQKIDDVYSAYVDSLAARQTVRYTRESVRVLNGLLGRTQELLDHRQISQSDLNRVKNQLRTSRLGQLDAEESERKAKLGLASVLAITPAEAMKLELYGSIQDRAPPPAPTEELARIALDSRPDIASFRLGIRRAESDVRLARANRLTDIYILAQPFTFQNNAPYGLPSQYSWALGATVPLPLYNRNQGAIQRANLNVTQSQIQLEDLERSVLIDVERAVREYTVTRQEVEEIQAEILPTARQIRDDAHKLYIAGSTGITDYIAAQIDFNQVVKQYLDTAIRHRRSMLALNTAIGRRILP
ncbi:outer membrane protein, cobalt-zinc-cadmium efflux system [Singulisphaera sp. GP187]|uniref:TolC family protein n=1 Tax=Singulisphaera sp. GP187 TaxID=1882752 RepID=UPI00092A3E2D|nr:TolC family protein [Singulisphaera sp. GP187]SIN74640.1 outer membrane protein, cobalt-zinc-cadmium efflux system [Singulisphaera sp. GP187]